MGYQETFLRIKSTKFFDACIDAINSTGKEYYEDFFQPVVIFTFTKDHKPFKKGEKAIYFVGDRSGQRSVSDLLGCTGDPEIIDECNDLLGFKDGICEAIFTEEVNPKGIFADSGKVTDVEAEPFEFSETGPFPDAESCLENFAKNVYEETPEEEQKFVSKKILKSSLYKKYEEFRDYLISKDFGILHGPRDSFTFKVLAPILFDEEEFLQKLNESGFALVNVLFPEEELDRYIFFVLRDKDNIFNEEDGNTAFFNFSGDIPDYEPTPIEDFKKDVENAYEENSELTDVQQENMKKTVSLVNCLLDMGITIRDYYYDFDDDACTFLWVKISNQIDFDRLKNAVIESGYGIKDWTNWDDMYAFLPGLDLEFFLNTDDDNGNDYFENYEENVKKALVSAEAHLNEFLADSSIQVVLQRSGAVPPKLVYQMNAMCKELATLGCMIKLIHSSDSECGDDLFFNWVEVKTSGKIDFNKFRDILKKYSFYISTVLEGTIRLESLWDISECNIFWYC